MRSKSKKSSRNSSKTKLMEDEKIEELIRNITLKRPPNCYALYLKEMWDKDKRKGDERFSIVKVSKEYHDKWQGLSDKEQQKYRDRFEDAKAQFNKDLFTVRHYLFKDYNDSRFAAPTAYRIFLNERIQDAFDKDEDIETVTKNARREWQVMSEEDKKVYLQKKKKVDGWFERCKKSTATGIRVYIQRRMEELRNSGKEIPNAAEFMKEYKKLSQKEKNKYNEYAMASNEERKGLFNLYEITHCVEPQRPAGAYKLFLQELAKNKELRSIQEGREKWIKLSKEEKDEYLNKSKLASVAYRYKKIVFQKKINKLKPKKPAPPFSRFLHEKKGTPTPTDLKPTERFAYWRDMYDKLPTDKKKKYIDAYKSAKERYEKRMEIFRNKVFSFPQRARGPFAFYIKEKIPELAEENKVGKKKLDYSQLVKEAADEWNNMKDSEKVPYYKMAKTDLLRYKRQKKEFNKLGYYMNKNLSTKGDDEDEEETQKKSTKKRSKSSKSSAKRSKKSARSKSRSKRSSKKSKSKSRSKGNKRRTSDYDDED